MPGMKRFVTYIYSYEDNHKGNNVGFAKIELRGDVFRLEIHLRGLFPSHTLCRVCLIRIENGMITGFPIGRMELLNGTGDCSLGMSASNISDSGYSIRDMDGLLLFDEENRFFVSRWKEGEALIVDAAHFKEWSASDTQDVPAATAAQDSSGLQNSTSTQDSPGSRNYASSQNASSPQNSSAVQNSSAASQAPAQNSSATSQSPAQDTLSATELPMHNFFPRYRLEDVWESLSTGRTVSTPFTEKNVECLKIELKDLRELPRRFWYLGNNSFLLHGFFNYRYLVLAKCPNGRWFLGIPGIYQNQERVMATIFGFPEFLSEWIPDAPENQEPINHFGCWYRFLDEA